MVISVFLFLLSGALDSSSNTSETSIMSFLSAMESRSPQAGPVSASLLPPFRPPSWPAGEDTYIHSVFKVHTTYHGVSKYPVFTMFVGFLFYLT